MFCRFIKRFISAFLVVAVMLTSYATDLDTVFGIRAYAASYEDTATSMIQFYKEGTKLDRSKISTTELYVFGVFISNFLMPFQSNVGYMSSDAFAVEMAAMFFGDAYTAQQYSDMKYTLGLVQSAQSTRARLVSCTDGTFVTWQNLLSNFGGFYSPTQTNGVGTVTYYTWEGSDRMQRADGYALTDKEKDGTDPLDDIVWQSNTTQFSAIMGQLISICPSQAGYYAGTESKYSSLLYVDPFGNISDMEGTLIIPACMNPYSFYNKSLNADREIKVYQDGRERPSDRAPTICPLQLPINNAFWMGTMVDPRDLAMNVTTTVWENTDSQNDDGSVTYDLVDVSYTSWNIQVNKKLELEHFNLYAPGVDTVDTELNFDLVRFDWGWWVNKAVHPYAITYGGWEGSVFKSDDYNTVLDKYSTLVQFILSNELDAVLEGDYLTDGSISVEAVLEPYDGTSSLFPMGRVISYVPEDERASYEDTIGISLYSDTFHQNAWKSSDLMFVYGTDWFYKGGKPALDLPEGDNSGFSAFLSALCCPEPETRESCDADDHKFSYKCTGCMCNLLESMGWTVGSSSFSVGDVTDFSLLYDEDATDLEASYFDTNTRMPRYLLVEAPPIMSSKTWAKYVEAVEENGGVVTEDIAQGIFFKTPRLVYEMRDSTPLGDTAVSTTQSYRKVLTSLPNLYGFVDQWSTSTTVLVGIDTYDGSELGIYFSQDIADAYTTAFRVAKGYTGAIMPGTEQGENVETIDDITGTSVIAALYSPEGISKYGFWNPWHLAGGTAVPISLVLDDIVLFDTYNNFSDSLADSLYTMSMYRSTDLEWWATDPLKGTEVKSLYLYWVNSVSEYLKSIDPNWDTFKTNAANAIVKYWAETLDTTTYVPSRVYDNASAIYLWQRLSNLSDTELSVSEDVVNTADDFNDIFDDVDFLGTYEDAYTSGENSTLESLLGSMGGTRYHADVINADKKTLLAQPFAKSIAWADDAFPNVVTSSSSEFSEAELGWELFMIRTLLSIVSEDPVWLFPPMLSSNFDPFSDGARPREREVSSIGMSHGLPSVVKSLYITNANVLMGTSFTEAADPRTDVNSSFLTSLGGSDYTTSRADTVAADTQAGTPILNDSVTSLSVGWEGSVTYSNHFFLQKAGFFGAAATTVTGIGDLFYKAVFGIAAVLNVIALVVAVVAVVAMVVAGSVSGGLLVAAAVAVAVVVSTAVIMASTSSASDKIADSAVNSYDKELARVKSLFNNTYGVTKFNYAYAAMAYVAMDGDYVVASNASDPLEGIAAYKNQPAILNLALAYGADTSSWASYAEDVKDNLSNGNNTITSATGSAGAASNAYTSVYRLYGPYATLASSLAAVSRVYTGTEYLTVEEVTQTVSSGDSNLFTSLVNASVNDKVGSYITNDVNMWGGIYYAYMIDILGLDIDADNTMTAATLDVNFPDFSDSLTGSDSISFEGLLGQDSDELEAEKEDETRRALMSRLMELTDTNTSEYRNKLLTSTTNSWVLSTHASIVGADTSGSIASVGGGTQYTGYSGYITTSTLSEMPFTSWVMEHYEMLYGILLLLILVVGICMLLTGHRSLRKVIFTVLCMSVILLIPRITIDTAVNMTNTAAASMYKDRFSFWAYAQHQQLNSELRAAERDGDELRYLLVTNMQQAQDYYDSESGVTLKWMSPKKESYWDQLSNVSGDSDDGLNLSLFTWLFQGQFRQEIYSADPLATYLFRPYNDIVQTVESFMNSYAKKGLSYATPAPHVQSGTSGFIGDSYATLPYVGTGESDVPRASYAGKTLLGWQSYYEGVVADYDLKPYWRQEDYSARTILTSAPGAQDIAKLQLQALPPSYAVNMINDFVTDISYSNYLGKEDTESYLQQYPSVKNTTTLQNGGTAGLQGVSCYETADDSKDGTLQLKQFYLYSESPYYYFYYVFKMAIDQHGTPDDGMRSLLLSEDYFKYSGPNEAVVSTGKATVDSAELVDFLALEELFTFVIPYLQQSNMYVDEWTDLWGMELDATSDNEHETGAGTNKVNQTFKDNLEGIWKMYSPWVDAMYDTGYVASDIKSVGEKYHIVDAINPGYYTDVRKMVFSPAEMERNYLTESDLSSVETRIMRVLENTYTDLMYLNNYITFDNEVLISAAAMIATFNFNEEFSYTSFMGDDILLYPTGYEIRNFSYDAFLRLALLNTTGASVFSETDVYTEVIENTSIVTGILLLLNDIVAVYLVPAFKLVILLALFFLGLTLCVGCFLQPPERLWRHLARHFLAPFGIFFGVLLTHMCVVALFVGEGVTSIVGSRGVTVTTGDPTITILLLLLVNCLFLFGMWQVLKLLLKSFKISLNVVAASVVGFVGGAVAMGARTIKGAVRGTTKVATGTIRGAGKVADTVVGKPTRAVARHVGAYHRDRRAADMNAEALYRRTHSEDDDSSNESGNSGNSNSNTSNSNASTSNANQSNNSNNNAERTTERRTNSSETTANTANVARNDNMNVSEANVDGANVSIADAAIATIGGIGGATLLGSTVKTAENTTALAKTQNIDDPEVAAARRASDKQIEEARADAGKVVAQDEQVRELAQNAKAAVEAMTAISDSIESLESNLEHGVDMQLKELEAVRSQLENEEALLAASQKSNKILDEQVRGARGADFYHSDAGVASLKAETMAGITSKMQNITASFDAALQRRAEDMALNTAIAYEAKYDSAQGITKVMETQLARLNEQQSAMQKQAELAARNGNQEMVAELRKSLSGIATEIKTAQRNVSAARNEEAIAKANYNEAFSNMEAAAAEIAKQFRTAAAAQAQQNMANNHAVVPNVTNVTNNTTVIHQNGTPSGGQRTISSSSSGTGGDRARPRPGNNANN